MAAGYVILVSVDGAFASAVDGERLGAVARRVLESEGAEACELSVTVTDDDTVRRLNREYAGEDEVTDVLSFSQREGEAFVGGESLLGEVIVSYPQALRQSSGQALRQAKGDVGREVERLLVHGVLHLLGYDHADTAEAGAMREREERLLAGDAAD